MKNTELMNKMSRTLGRAGLKLKKHSPEILMVAGVVGVVTSAVMACKATTKAGDIIEEMKENMEEIHQVREMDRDDYTDEDFRKDTALVYLRTGVNFVKLYGPSVALGALSITSMVASHVILHKRNVALAAAYTAIDRSFKEYRGRVVERFGKEIDRELKYNIKAKEIEEKIIDEDGNEKIVKKTVDVIDPNMHSEYARFFDEYCVGFWQKDAEYNFTFLVHQQNYASDVLKRRGHLFLNEVYDMLGIPRTKAGQVVGWVYDEKNPVGDNFVDFGIFDRNDPNKRLFVRGDERSILLDFNVDGDILDLI